MYEVPPFSPGCFGSAIAFRKEDMVCQACPFAEKCEVAHEITLKALRERYGIKPPQPRTAQRAKKQEAHTADPAATVLPKKARELIERLDRSQIDICGSLRRGVNPFGKGLNFMRIACHILLRASAPFDREFLSDAFVKALGWQKNTADAHARMAIMALTHVGAIENRDGLISLRKA